MTDSQKDDHIEELLEKLQGIFGKLSHSEEEEAKEKIEIPSAAPKEAESKETPPVHETEPASSKSASPAPLNLYPEPSPAPSAPPANSEADAPIDAGYYETTVPLEDPEKVIVPAAVYFHPGHEAEGRALAQRLETMAPKFTKVAFRLRVGVFMPYDPKGDWKDLLIANAAEAGFQSVFVLMDRPMEDMKRKTIAADLESRNVYFQEVTLAVVEKKAFYTDILLGLVFFFDSRKPKTDAPDTAS